MYLKHHQKYSSIQHYVNNVFLDEYVQATTENLRNIFMLPLSHQLSEGPPAQSSELRNLGLLVA